MSVLNMNLYQVEYLYNGEFCRNNFNYEHEAKHFAVDISNDKGVSDILVCEFGSYIGRIESINNCNAFVRI